ncbi:MAG TPA: hypothetical protein VGK67_32185 [Myxococcales bacterium]
MTLAVFLIPGFFGFHALGKFNYFHGVGTLLSRQLEGRGLAATVVELPTLPTSSIRRRAAQLALSLGAEGAREASDIVLVGHSVGGLDARLVATPDVRLLSSTDIESEVGRRLRSVVTIASPHYGTPVASFFNGLQGRNLLYLAARLSVSGPGRLLLTCGAHLFARGLKVGECLRARADLAQLHLAHLPRDIRRSSEGEFWQFFRAVAKDQGALLQLAPESMDLFNAAATDRPGVRYACVAAAAPAPPLGLRHARFRSVFTPLSMALYGLTYWLASRADAAYPYAAVTPEECERLAAALGRPCTPDLNDGMVPTLSQLWGELIHVAQADHLDLVGQFDGAGDPAYTGWLSSGSPFGQAEFEQLWSSVAEDIAQTVRAPERPTKGPPSLQPSLPEGAGG